MGTVIFGADTVLDPETGKTWFQPNIEIIQSDGSNYKYVLTGYVKTEEKAREIAEGTEVILRSPRHGLRIIPNGSDGGPDPGPDAS